MALRIKALLASRAGRPRLPHRDAHQLRQGHPLQRPALRLAGTGARPNRRAPGGRRARHARRSHRRAQGRPLAAVRRPAPHRTPAPTTPPLSRLPRTRRLVGRRSKPGDGGMRLLGRPARTPHTPRARPRPLAGRTTVLTLTQQEAHPRCLDSSGMLATPMSARTGGERRSHHARNRRFAELSRTLTTRSSASRWAASAVRRSVSSVRSLRTRAARLRSAAARRSTTTSPPSPSPASWWCGWRPRSPGRPPRPGGAGRPPRPRAQRVHVQIERLRPLVDSPLARSASTSPSTPRSSTNSAPSWTGAPTTAPSAAPSEASPPVSPDARGGRGADRFPKPGPCPPERPSTTRNK